MISLLVHCKPGWLHVLNNLLPVKIVKYTNFCSELGHSYSVLCILQTLKVNKQIKIAPLLSSLPDRGKCSTIHCRGSKYRNKERLNWHRCTFVVLVD